MSLGAGKARSRFRFQKFPARASQGSAGAVMVLPMQKKSIGTLGATCALLAVLASCGVGQAEPGNENQAADSASSNMSTSLQDGDIRHPPTSPLRPPMP